VALVLRLAFLMSPMIVLRMKVRRFGEVVIDRSGKSVLRSLRNTRQICARASHPDLKRTIRTRLR
jgi:hypothetical protein